MMKRAFIAVLPLISLTGVLTAQDRVQAVYAGTTPLAIATALAAELEPQGFKLVKKGGSGALFVQDLGMIAQSTGGQAHVTQEVNFRMRQRGDSVEVRVEETLVGEGGPAYEYRRTQDPRRNREAYTALFENVRGRLATMAADSASGSGP